MEGTMFQQWPSAPTRAGHSLDQNFDLPELNTFDPEAFDIDTAFLDYELQPNAPVVEDRSADSPGASEFSEDEQSIIPEHFGLGCWLSICSPAGLKWVKECAGSDRFDDIAVDFTAAWGKHLRLSREKSAMLNPEPPVEMAWKYYNVYFQHSLDSVLGVIHQPGFDQQLHRHFENPSLNVDPAQYALRNVVYASGCRLYHSAQHACSFTSIQEEAWSYFSNALSVHSELLLRRPSTDAIRALLAMALFAEGIGSPALGSTLIANAALLSQSLGLHQKHIRTVCSSDSAFTQYTWLFWAVYCCEKNISRRTGRPSVIDDDDVTCELPDTTHPGSSVKAGFVRHLVKSCQLSSRFCKRLTLDEGLFERPLELLDVVTGFHQQLSSLQDSSPLTRHLKDFPKQPHASSDGRSLEETLLQSSIHNIMMVLHAPFAYPWITGRLKNMTNAGDENAIETQSALSSDIAAKAARGIIVMTRSFDINGANTNAFMLHYPMHAFISLFVHILRFPDLRSVQADLALLDVAAGYFGQLEFITNSMLSFPFVRDIAALARTTVEGYCGRPGQPSLNR